MADVGVLLEITDRLRAFQQARRRLGFLVHRGYFQGGQVPFYFVKVTNLSSARDIVITHVWFEAAPPSATSCSLRSTYRLMAPPS